MKKLIFLLILGFYFPAVAGADLLTPPTTLNDPEKEGDLVKEGGMMLPDGKKMLSDDFNVDEKAEHLQKEGKMILPEEKNVQPEETKGEKVGKRSKKERTNRPQRKKKEHAKGEDRQNHSKKHGRKANEESAEEPAKNEGKDVKSEEEAVEGDENVETSEQPTEIERGQARQKRPQRGEGEHRRKKQQRPNRKQAEEPAGDGEVKSEQADPKTIRQGVVDDEPKVYDMKPIIYLYPTTETAVSVKVGKVQNLTHTYPKYENGWYVTAQPNGDLKDTSGRSYYALYWEGVHSASSLTDGFIVKGTDTINFLEEKLALLGLTEREANEFIVYWLPRLESNEYNFIRFETRAEIDENMPLYVTPAPDTVVRVMMEYRPADKAEQVKPQQLPSTPKREGFVVVEWGGTQSK